MSDLRYFLRIHHDRGESTALSHADQVRTSEITGPEAMILQVWEAALAA